MRAKKKVDLFLDSGAFSAWTQGVEIDIQQYIAFIKEHLDVISIYANLDVIGVGGKQPNRLTAERTLENQKIMEKAGLHPLPVFHFGEPIEYLQYYVDNYEYIALGVAGNFGNALIPWLDDCFSNYICDKDGYPKVKPHGFAVTSIKIMKRYPWFSVDSTSWVITSRMGSIFVPGWRQENWVYDENAWKISVSNRNPSRNEMGGRHIETLSPKQREIVEKYINEKGYCLGRSEFVTVSSDHVLQSNERWAEKKTKNKERLLEIMHELGISNRHQFRDELNILFFLDLERSLPEWPWRFERRSANGFFW